jgi:hypothetical protein
VDPYTFVTLPEGFEPALRSGPARVLAANPVWSRQHRVGGLIVPAVPTGNETGRVLLQRVRGLPLAPTLQVLECRRRADLASAPLVASVQIDEESRWISGALLSGGGSADWPLIALKEVARPPRTWKTTGPYFDLDTTERFSRTALPGGETTLQRAPDVLRHVVLCGFGRGGSQLVTALCQTLPVQQLTVVDPDVFDGAHHLNAHRALPRRGVPKAAAAVPLLSPYGVAVTAIDDCFERRDVVEHVCGADLLLLWPDEQGMDARRLGALAAAAFAVPSLSLGTRVDAEGGGQVDVFFSLPFAGACLLCMASLPDAWDPRPERAGSLLSVNLLAVSLALQLVQEWLAGMMPVSQWYQATVAAGEAVAVTKRGFAVNQVCPVCARWGGGDTAWARWMKIS